MNECDFFWTWYSREKMRKKKRLHWPVSLPGSTAKDTWTNGLFPTRSARSIAPDPTVRWPISRRPTIWGPMTRKSGNWFKWSTIWISLVTIWKGLKYRWLCILIIDNLAEHLPSSSSSSSHYPRFIKTRQMNVSNLFIFEFTKLRIPMQFFGA